MIILEFLLIVNLLILCAYSSYTDLRHSLIRNKAIIISCCVSGLLNVSYYIFYGKEYFKLFAVNFLLMSVFSVLMYALSIWAAGDSKMMMAVMLSIPGRIFDADTIAGVIPGLPIMMAAFSFAFIYVAGDSLRKWVKRKDRIHIDFLFELKSFIKSYIYYSVYILSFNGICMLLLNDFFLHNVLLLSMLDLFFMLILSRVNTLKKKTCFIFALIILTVYMVVSEIKFSVSDINWMFYLFLFGVLLIRLVAERYNYEMIPTKDVKNGMVLSNRTILTMSISRIKGLPTASTEDLRSRISEEEADSIHRWETSKYGMPEVEIVQKIPFAIFISLGTVVFLLSRVGGFR